MQDQSNPRAIQAMGQYWVIVNLDKRECIDPCRLGSGAKLWEILSSRGVGAALVALLAAEREQKATLDLELDYDEARAVVGRWAGDRIAIVGDYASDDDLPEAFRASTIYTRCVLTEEEILDDIRDYLDDGMHEDAAYLEEVLRLGLYRDITDLVKKVVRHELERFGVDASFLDR